jgi:hypothetical protein
MLLQHPSYARHAAAMTLAWSLLLGCIALDFYSTSTLAHSAMIGVQFSNRDGVVVVSALNAQGALARAGFAAVIACWQLPVDRLKPPPLFWTPKTP